MTMFQARTLSGCYPLELLSLLCVLAMSIRPLQAQESLDDGIYEDIPVVLSATRLRQSLHDAPVSMTIIDREMIDASGFTEIPDLMHLVPGFVVDYDSGHLPVTGYHMLHDRYVRHQQVLIDGRSVYTPILGGVPWVDLPITMDDIERIEVVRGPNAASYGSNSFLGVINIITRDSALDRGTRVKTNLGDNGLREGFLRHGSNLGDMNYVFSLAYREDRGFERRHDDKQVKIATFRSDYQFDSNDSLILQVGYNGGIREEDNTIDTTIPDFERSVNSQYQQIRWIRALPDYGELRVQYYRTALDEDKKYPASDQSFVTERHDLELQHTFSAGEKTRVVWGASYRRDQSESDYYVAEQAPEYVNIGRLFGNVEYRYSSSLFINGGLMIEDNDLAEVDYLPRLGVNYHLDSQNTIRASISRASREPVLTEEYPDFGGFYWENDVEPEYITAYELGYLTKTKDGSITADLKYFYEELSGLINYDRASAPDGTIWFNNFDDVIIRGIEAQLTLRPSEQSRVHIVYSNKTAWSSNAVQESRYDIAVPENILSILGIWKLGPTLTTSMGYYYSSDRLQLAYETDEPPEYEPMERVDLRVAKEFRTLGPRQEISFVLQNAFNHTQEANLNNFFGRRFYLSYKLELD